MEPLIATLLDELEFTIPADLTSEMLKSVCPMTQRCLNSLRECFRNFDEREKTPITLIGGLMELSSGKKSHDSSEVQLGLRQLSQPSREIILGNQMEALIYTMQKCFLSASFAVFGRYGGDSELQWGNWYKEGFKFDQGISDNQVPDFLKIFVVQRIVG